MSLKESQVPKEEGRAPEGEVSEGAKKYTRLCGLVGKQEQNKRSKMLTMNLKKTSSRLEGSGDMLSRSRSPYES
jgi:hypothetical protein